MKSLVKLTVAVALLVIGLCSCGGGSGSALMNITKKTVVSINHEDYSSLQVTLYKDGTCHSEGVYRASGNKFSYDGDYTYRGATFHDVQHNWISIEVRSGSWIDIMKDGSVYGSLTGEKFENLDSWKRGEVTSID